MASDPGDRARTGEREDSAGRGGGPAGETVTGPASRGARKPGDFPDQTGRLAVVTGANSGLGYVTARELGRRGAHVVLACRSPERGLAAMDRLRQEIPSVRAELRRLDLADLASVREFADTWDHNRIDLLVNNAGIALAPLSRTVDGFESHFGTNHLGTFALTGLLLPGLLAAPEPRVVTVSSEAQRFARVDFGNLNAERRFRRWSAYLQSKKANVYFAAELQRRAAAVGSRLRSMAAAPGLSRTNVLAGGAGSGHGFLLPLVVRHLAKSATEGALTSLYAATVPGLPGGAYIVPGGPLQQRGMPVSRDRERALHDIVTARRLWTISEQLTGVRYRLDAA